MNDLMQKLMVSKQIMDRHNEMDRGAVPKANPSRMSESYAPQEYNETPIPATYNIPQEYMETQPSVPIKPPVVTEDRIKNSKLPDSIKKLMMEHPISQPQSYQPTISDDIIERAARLMNENKPITQSSNTSNTSNTKQQPQSLGITASDIKKIVRETVEEVLNENGLLIESTQKTNELMTIKVGKHIFEGKISKIKKTA
jgi:hypothetical protein